MHLAPATTLACPIDGEALSVQAGSLACPRGHTFDRAKEGYWNLLVVQHKASRDPGDSKEMVAARRRTLDAGHFLPVAEQVFAEIRRLTGERGNASHTPMSILDAGCGEGWYLDQIARMAAASSGGSTLALTGVDISKWAVKAAAKRTTAVTWAVANSRHLPLLPGCVDLILCLFGFQIWDGFRAVQRAGQHVLLADPGPDHLIELRRLIYPEIKPGTLPSLERAMALGYRVASQSTVTHTICLESRQAIADLVAMTPHAHRMPASGRAALDAIDRLPLTIDVALRLLRLDAQA